MGEDDAQYIWEFNTETIGAVVIDYPWRFKINDSHYVSKESPTEPFEVCGGDDEMELSPMADPTHILCVCTDNHDYLLFDYNTGALLAGFGRRYTRPNRVIDIHLKWNNLLYFPVPRPRFDVPFLDNERAFAIEYPTMSTLDQTNGNVACTPTVPCTDVSVETYTCAYFEIETLFMASKRVNFYVGINNHLFHVYNFGDAASSTVSPSYRYFIDHVVRDEKNEEDEKRIKQFPNYWKDGRTAVIYDGRELSLVLNMHGRFPEKISIPVPANGHITLGHSNNNSMINVVHGTFKYPVHLKYPPVAFNLATVPPTSFQAIKETCGVWYLPYYGFLSDRSLHTNIYFEMEAVPPSNVSIVITLGTDSRIIYVHELKRFFFETNTNDRYILPSFDKVKRLGVYMGLIADCVWLFDGDDGRRLGRYHTFNVNNKTVPFRETHIPLFTNLHVPETSVHIIDYLRTYWKAPTFHKRKRQCEIIRGYLYPIVSCESREWLDLSTKDRYTMDLDDEFTGYFELITKGPVQLCIMTENDFFTIGVSHSMNKSDPYHIGRSTLKSELPFLFKGSALGIMRAQNSVTLFNVDDGSHVDTLTGLSLKIGYIGLKGPLVGLGRYIR